MALHLLAHIGCLAALPREQHCGSSVASHHSTGIP
jgi:hypothetical protein